MDTTCGIKRKFFQPVYMWFLLQFYTESMQNILQNFNRSLQLGVTKLGSVISFRHSGLMVLCLLKNKWNPGDCTSFEFVLRSLIT